MTLNFLNETQIQLSIFLIFKTVSFKIHKFKSHWNEYSVTSFSCFRSVVVSTLSSWANTQMHSQKIIKSLTEVHNLTILLVNWGNWPLTFNNIMRLCFLVNTSNVDIKIWTAVRCNGKKPNTAILWEFKDTASQTADSFERSYFCVLYCWIISRFTINNMTVLYLCYCHSSVEVKHPSNWTSSSKS